LSTRSSPIAAIPALLLVVVSLWEVAATRCDATAVPDDDAWKRAEAVVRAEYRPGDLIVFAPDWVDPVGRLHLGDLIPVDVAARMDAARFSRIWEVSIRGARAPETEGLEPAATIDDLHRMLMKLPVGVPAVVTLLRGGRKLERMVIPADYPER